MLYISCLLYITISIFFVAIVIFIAVLLFNITDDLIKIEHARKSGLQTASDEPGGKIY